LTVMIDRERKGPRPLLSNARPLLIAGVRKRCQKKGTGTIPFGTPFVLQAALKK
jgi:hypothetical protein